MAIQMPEKVKRIKPPTFEKKVIVIHGRAGMGKSTLASLFPDNIFIASEPGLDYLEVYEPMEVHSWEDFGLACVALSRSDHKGFVTIDTYDKLVTFATDYICRREKIKHPADYAMGKGWGMITLEINRVLTKYLTGNYGLIIVSHTKLSEVKTKTDKIHRATLSTSGGPSALVIDMADHIFYIDGDVTEGVERRVLRTEQSLYWEAKDKSRRLPAIIEYPIGFKYEDLTKYFKEK